MFVMLLVAAADLFAKAGRGGLSPLRKDPPPRGATAGSRKDQQGGQASAGSNFSEGRRGKARRDPASAVTLFGARGSRISRGVIQN